MIFIRNTFLIEVLYTLIIGLISLILKNKNFLAKKINSKGCVRNCGFLPVIMCEITLLCICNPNTKVKFLSIPWEFKAKYYPFIWFLVFCCVNNYHNDIEIFTGIIYAFLYQWSLKHYLNIHLIVLLKKWKIIISVLNGCLKLEDLLVTLLINL